MKCYVIESYLDYAPPFPIAPIVEDLLRCVNPKLTAGIKYVLVTNAAALPRAERRLRVKSQGHKVNLIERRGYYQPAWNGQEAYIQLKADMIIPKRWAAHRNRFADPLNYRLAFGYVLYHEIGHHIHFTQKPEHREKERVANKYMYRLLRRMLLRRLYLLPSAAIGSLVAATRRA